MKSPRTRNAGHWTEAQFFGALREALRRIARFWRPKVIALERARVDYPRGKLRFAYRCAECGRLFRREGVEADHVVPAGSLRSLADLPGFVERLLPESPDAYRVLCKRICHAAKTRAENAARPR